MKKESQKLTLTIDASDRYCKKIILQSGSKLIDEVEGNIDIVFEISNLLEKKNINISEIDEIKSFPGPGSFTGLKIGSVISNVLNWALGKKVLKELNYPSYGSEPNIQKN